MITYQTVDVKRPAIKVRDCNAWIRQVSDCYGGRTETTYHTLFDCVKSIVTANSDAVDYTYDSRGRVREMTYPYGRTVYRKMGNGTEHTYTADEVAEQRGSCTDMEYMYTHETSGAIVRYYTVCEWD